MRMEVGDRVRVRAYKADGRYYRWWLAPDQQRLGLTRVPTYTGDYRWLCRQHYREWEPKIPDVIEAS